MSNSALLVAGVAADLLLAAAVASLDNSHQVSVVALLLGLGTARSRVCDVHTILGHNLHTGDVREVSRTVP